MATRRRPSAKFGTVNYSADEMRRLNAKVRAVLPLAGEDWLRVAYQFNYLRPEAVPYREVESLKRKFKKMYCARGKTLPDYAQEAKELRRLISQRSDRAAVDASNETQQGEEQEQAQAEAQAPGLQKEAARGLALKLQQMEEEYHKTLAGKRSEKQKEGVAGGVGTATPHVGGSVRTTSTSTSEVVAMLRQSVDRKRRSVEEQMLSESVRVRRERKKHKMEQVLLSIHQEQREQELAGGGSAVTTEVDAAASPAESSPIADPNHKNGAPPSCQPACSQLPADSAAAARQQASLYPMDAMAQPASFHDVQALGLLEVLLQFMTAQQLENAQRLEVEQARREQERREREKHWHEEGLQRRKDHRELMLTMGALLGDRFPDSLKRYLNDDQQQQSTVSTPPTAGSTQGEYAERDAPGAQSSVHLSAKSSVSEPATTTDRSDTGISVEVGSDSVQTHVQQQADLRVDDEATSSIL